MNWKISENKDWQYLKSRFDWVADMEGVPQDPIHHAEGDVETHVKWVLRELRQLPEYSLLPEDQRELLYAATLLHDVEKRSTTIQEPNGRISSRGHARKGAQTARTLIYREFPAGFKQREQVANLVRCHSIPLWAIEREDPAKTVIRSSLTCDTRLLYLLARADVLGRECADQAELLERVELFREICLEQDCWGKAREFPDGLTRYAYLSQEGRSPDFKVFDDSAFTAHVMCALPGSGKDTWISQHLEGMPMVSLDEIRRSLNISPGKNKKQGQVFQLAKERARESMRKKEDFVWNATNLGRQTRNQLFDFFRSYGGKIRLIYLEVPYQELLVRNKSRKWRLPEAKLEQMISKWEAPALFEAEEVVLITGD